MNPQSKSHPLERGADIFLHGTLALLAVYYGLAYWVAPTIWRHYEHQPKMESAPKTTFTKEGIPGDPLNVGLVGGESDVIRSMVAAGWMPADPITFRTSARITASALFGKAYPTAPVSNLYVFGRVEDLAFEQPVPGNTRQRNHVRFWRSDELGRDGKPFWIGAATFDQSVGVSHLTGKITHHIAPDLDAERDKLMGDLLAHGQLVSQYQVTGIGNMLWGRNGGGDKYFTDGELSVGVLTAGGSANTGAVSLPQNPVGVQAKNGVWSVFRWLFRKL
jgi:hypothetical protein